MALNFHAFSLGVQGFFSGFRVQGLGVQGVRVYTGCWGPGVYGLRTGKPGYSNPQSPKPLLAPGEASLGR